MKYINYMAEFLKDEVNINEARLDTLAGNVNAIISHLAGCDEVGDIYLGHSKQGSWAHGTIVKPQRNQGFDADILAHFDNANGLGPTELIDAVYKGLRESSVYKEKASRKSRCVKVNYEGEHHVDVVPFVGDPRELGKIANRSDDVWEATDPQAFKDWFGGKNRATDGELKRVLRLLKYLRDIKQTFSVKSVILTVLVAERVDVSKEYPDTPTALKVLLGDLADYLDQHPTVPPYLVDPSNPEASLNHRWAIDSYPNLVSKIRFYADKVGDAYDEGDKATSMKLWREVFPEFGTAPEKMAKSRAADEEFMETDRHIPTRLDPNVTCTLTCTSGGKQINRSLVSMSHHKRNGLDFEVHTNATGKFEVYWKVKNTGKEARADGALRGEIEERGLKHHESIEYEGDHFVEVYIVRNRICVAKALRDFAFRRLGR